MGFAPKMFMKMLERIDLRVVSSNVPNSSKLEAAVYAARYPPIRFSNILIKLVSTAGTGYYYTTKKNPRNSTEKFIFRKYDPVVRKHVEFKEAKIK